MVTTIVLQAKSLRIHRWLLQATNQLRQRISSAPLRFSANNNDDDDEDSNNNFRSVFAEKKNRLSFNRGLSQTLGQSLGQWRKSLFDFEEDDLFGNKFSIFLFLSLSGRDKSAISFF